MAEAIWESDPDLRTEGETERTKYAEAKARAAQDPLPPGKGPSPPEDLIGPLPDAFSEDRLALNFTARHYTDWCYIALWGQWLQWQQTHWRREETLRVFELARRVCRETSVSTDKVGLARAVASSKTVAGVERLARSDRRHAMTFDQFDASDWDFNQPPRKE